MTTVAEKRAVLREHGIEVPDHGRLGEQYTEAYEAIMDGTFTGAALPPEPPPAGEPAEDAAGEQQVQAENVPGSVRGPGRGSRVRGLLGGRRRDAGPGSKSSKGSGGKKGGRSKPSRPWMPTAGIIESLYERAAMAAGGIPPLQRTLAVLAPMSGAVLQDQMRGTIADRVVLQPIARSQAQMDVAAAMLGFPAMVAWIAMKGNALVEPDPETGQPRVVLDKNGAPVWDDATQFKVTGLKFTMMSLLRMSDRAAEDIQEHAEETIRLGREAERLIGFIFSATAGQSWNDVRDAAQAAGADFTRSGRGQSDLDPEPPDTRYPDGPAGGTGSSAYRPAPALSASVLPP